MRFSIVYVLVCAGRDRVAIMTDLSVQALRRLYPSARVVLLTDPASEPHLLKSFPSFLGRVDEVVAVSPPDTASTQRLRSRYLKVHLRHFVEGDFVFLDSDTLPVQRFDSIAQGPWDFAAVQDRNHLCPITPRFLDSVAADFTRLGWSYRDSPYFNSGVMYFRDTPAARALGEEWARRWLESAVIGRDCTDQFSLNAALYSTAVAYLALDSSYNALVRVHPSHARSAKIWHFTAGNSLTLDDSVLEHLVRYYEQFGQVDWQTLNRCVRMQHPWLPPYWPRRLWQTGNYTLAVRTAMARLPGKLLRAFRKSPAMT